MKTPRKPWDIGRIITQEIQKNEKRAGYGEQLLDSLAVSLIQEYGRGYSVSNLNDMRRFYEGLQILQTLPVESSGANIHQPPANKSSDSPACYQEDIAISKTGVYKKSASL